MSRRTSGMLATFALITSGFVALGGSTPAHAVDQVVPYCSAPAAPPCLVSFTRNDVAVNPSQYRVEWQEQLPGSGFYNWYVEKFDGSVWQTAMGSSENSAVFSTEFDFGTFNPRTFGALGSPQTADPVIWSGTKSDHHIQINASPTDLLWSCVYDPPDANTATCPYTAAANDAIPGMLFGVVNNGEWIGDTEAQHELSNGTYNFRNTNIGESTPLPVIDPVTGDQTLVFNLQNATESSTHVTFLGFQHVRLPNDLVRVEFGVPDPETMTSSSLVASVTGGSVGTVSITPEPSHLAMRISITGVTFTNAMAKMLAQTPANVRKITIKLGHINPTAPTHLKSWRISGAKGRLYFVKSYPRGARVTGYGARCANGSSIKTATGTSAGITFTNLTPGKPYACRVRSSSKAGYSAWSAIIRFAASP